MKLGPRDARLLLDLIEAAPKDMARFGLTADTLGGAEVLGRGANGVAFLLPGGAHVLKVTRDYDEALLADGLAGQSVRGFPTVRYVAQVAGGGSARVAYLIVSEPVVAATHLADGPLRSDLVRVLAYINGARGVGPPETKRQDDWLGDLLAAGETIIEHGGVGHLLDEADDHVEAVMEFLGTEADLAFSNVGLKKRDDRWEAVILDFGQITMPEVDHEITVAANRATARRGRR